MRPRRLSRCLAVVVPLALVGLVAACGSDAAPQSGGSIESNTTSAAPPEDGNRLKGPWAEQAGQADKVTQALTGKGFECTKGKTPFQDIRMCQKSVIKPEQKYSAQGEYVSRLRFLADGKGTVIKAAIEGGNSSGEPTPGNEMAKQIEDALLTPADAAIFAADGKKLAWGTVVEERDTLYLTATGAESPEADFAFPSVTLPVTKEQALPLLQPTGLTCKFSDTTKWGEKQQSLTCYDTSFKPPVEDGSIAGGTAEAILVDEGAGITSFSMEGSHTDGKFDLDGVKSLLPKVFAISKEEQLPQIQEWAGKHLDGLSHSAYIGNWIVSLSISKGGMLGSSATLHVGSEKDNFGKPRAK